MNQPETLISGTSIPWEATQLRGNRWAVHPSGCCGTCGKFRSRLWQVKYVNAVSAQQAIRKALQKGESALIDPATETKP